jgi:hypothetical protein
MLQLGVFVAKEANTVQTQIGQQLLSALLFPGNSQWPFVFKTLIKLYLFHY